METAQNKTIRLLERQMICSDPMAVHIMSVMNRHMYGRENILIREDMLCAMWSLKKGRADTVLAGTTVIRKIQTGRVAKYSAGDLSRS